MASVSVGRVVAQDAGKKVLPAPTPAGSPKYIDLGKGWHPRFRRAASPDSVVATVTRELHRMILPKVELNDVSLSDALHFFQQAFRDHDPEHHGMSFFIKLPRPNGAPTITRAPATDADLLPLTDDAPTSTSPPPSADSRPPEPRVTLKLRKVRYSEALDKLAAAAGLKWKIETYDIAFVPLSESTEPLFNAERAASPEAVGFPANTKDWLESKGVDFPPGAAAAYLSESHRLLVCQTQANFEKIRLIVTRPQNAPAQPSNL